jgi:hypothetical protein
MTGEDEHLSMIERDMFRMLTTDLNSLRGDIKNLHEKLGETDKSIVGWDHFNTYVKETDIRIRCNEKICELYDKDRPELVGPVNSLKSKLDELKEQTVKKEEFNKHVESQNKQWEEYKKEDKKNWDKLDASLDEIKKSSAVTQWLMNTIGSFLSSKLVQLSLAGFGLVVSGTYADTLSGRAKDAGYITSTQIFPTTIIIMLITILIIVLPIAYVIKKR